MLLSIQNDYFSWLEKRNDQKENHQLTLKLNHSRCNHSFNCCKNLKRCCLKHLIYTCEVKLQNFHALTPIYIISLRRF